MEITTSGTEFHGHMRPYNFKIKHDETFGGTMGTCKDDWGRNQMNRSRVRSGEVGWVVRGLTGEAFDCPDGEAGGG
jgi:hypothetical protein